MATVEFLLYFDHFAAKDYGENYLETHPKMIENLDLERCTAYSDSVNDVPMISKVRKPTMGSVIKKRRQRMSKMQDRAILRHYGAPLRFKTKDGLAVLIRLARAIGAPA